MAILSQYFNNKSKAETYMYGKKNSIPPLGFLCCHSLSLLSFSVLAAASSLSLVLSISLQEMYVRKIRVYFFYICFINFLILIGFKNYINTI